MVGRERWAVHFLQRASFDFAQDRLWSRPTTFPRNSASTPAFAQLRRGRQRGGYSVNRDCWGEPAVVPSNSRAPRLSASALAYPSFALICSQWLSIVLRLMPSRFAISPCPCSAAIKEITAISRLLRTSSVCGRLRSPANFRIARQVIVLLA